MQVSHFQLMRSGLLIFHLRRPTCHSTQLSKMNLLPDSLTYKLQRTPSTAVTSRTAPPLRTRQRTKATLTVSGTPCYLTTIACSTSIRMHGRPNTPLEGVGYRLFDDDGRIDVTYYIISPSSATNDNRRCAIKCLEELAKHPPSKVVQLYA